MAHVACSRPLFQCKQKKSQISAEKWQKPGGKAAEPFRPRSRLSASSSRLSPNSTVSPYDGRAQILPATTQFSPRATPGSLPRRDHPILPLCQSVVIRQFCRRRLSSTPS